MFYACCLLLYKGLLLQMEIPAQTVDIMYTAVTSYHLKYFTMCVLHITFSAPLSRVILEFVCEQQPDNFPPFHTPYPVSGFCQPHHSGVKGCEKASGADENGFDLNIRVRSIIFLSVTVLLS